MKTLLLISIGLFAFFGKSVVSHHCRKYFCLPFNKKCDDVLDGHHITLEEEIHPACEDEHGPGRLVYCCANQHEVSLQRAEMAKIQQLQTMKNLARAIAGAEKNEYPHQVQLRGLSLCGATVYNKNWIITAAHCVRSGNDTRSYTSSTGKFTDPYSGAVGQAFVIAGLSNLLDVKDTNIYPIDKVIWHEEWNPMKTADGHDIALLHVSRPLALEKGKIQPMKLEPANFTPNYGANGVFVGFGNVHEKLGSGSPDLMEFIAPIHHPARGIEISFEPLNADPNGRGVNDMNLAVGGGESKAIIGLGDSGGPFICGDENNKPILCGIASFKICGEFKFCKKPSYFQRVAPMLDWIKNNTNYERQEEELIFDELLFPEKIQNKKVPKSLVRIIHREKSCMGVIVTTKMIVAPVDCVKNPDFSKAYPIVYHFESESSLDYQGTGTGQLPEFQSNVSANVSHYMARPFNRNDMGFLILTTPVPANYAATLAPNNYQMKGRSVGYTFNKAVNSVEKRNYLEMDKEECALKLSAVDSNLKLTPDQLCMRQVYSAEKDCSRDLGSLLLCDNEQFLCGMGSFHGCKANGFPEIFSNYLSGEGTLREDLDVNMKANP